MKARLLIIGLTLGVVTVLVWLVAQPQLIGGQSAQLKKNFLEFTGLPTHYCPVSAQLVRLEGVQVKSDQAVAVSNCRTIDLQPLRSAQPSGTLIFLVKLPNALAERFLLPPDVTALTLPVQLGDITNDNTIDQNDEDLVTRQIFNSNKNDGGQNLDVDNDGRVTSLDLALVRLNRGVGVERPDHKAWKVLTNK